MKRPARKAPPNRIAALSAMTAIAFGCARFSSRACPRRRSKIITFMRPAPNSIRSFGNWPRLPLSLPWSPEQQMRCIASHCSSSSNWQPRCHSSRLRPEALRPHLSVSLPLAVDLADYAEAGAARQRIPSPTASQSLHIAVHKPRSLSELIRGGAPRLQHLSNRAKTAIALKESVRAALAGPLANHVTAAALRQQELTVWVDSAAFCARLRFEIPRVRD